MVHAAQFFYDTFADDIVRERNSRPTYKLFVAGHSLGAGTAALLCMMLQHRVPDIQAVCFAPPACASESLCRRYRPHIRSVILMHDVVPRFSLSSVRDLNRKVAGTNWKLVLKSNVQRDIKGLQERLERSERLMKVWCDGVALNTGVASPLVHPRHHTLTLKRSGNAPFVAPVTWLLLPAELWQVPSLPRPTHLRRGARESKPRTPLWVWPTLLQEPCSRHATVTRGS